ncbi:hypothetical protein SpiGrapes_1256 [Sphaerochaeta pleomorpha str. Grapes]|uniref:Lipoprotein n=1 Tax=Sphaerochaeta pleomorpha (strain ATCC BAA-1885 / DSM 22778 / Grapes) TaxID=158190 RepID=G8QTA3_SPHPG|nr:hypothetical protein [Sphaerochaeta pleomorpha]AEV29070.1 hypothetical protein SpiGrapes_1256 [Sphaerochaeta pleomorpha str. Grapes]
MKKSINVLLLVSIVLALSFSIMGCSKPAPVAQAPAAPAAKAPVSDGSEDLKIAYQVNLAKEDMDNYFSFTGNIRYMAVEKDHADAVTGASALGSTHLFQAYLYDVEGKNTLSSGLRGLFLFGVNPFSQLTGDALNASKASDGTITIQYAHRGTAYRIVTDKTGKLSFPNGTFEQRAIGYIAGSAPQVISKDFSADGTTATIDWAKVWDSKVASGTLVDDKSTKKTGDITRSADSADSMYYFDGSLMVTLENDILGINGSLTAVGR